jgi:hypothetical protein
MNGPTSYSSDVAGAVGSEHILDGGLLPGIGGPITVINIDGKGDHHIDLGLLDGFEDEM